MMHIRFVDPEVDVFVKCRYFLKFRFGWKQNLKSLKPDDEICVYFGNKFQPQIVVKCLGYNPKMHITEFIFLLYEGNEYHKSCKFYNSLLSTSAVDTNVEETYSFFTVHSIKQDALMHAKELTEEGERYQFEEKEKTIDDFNHKETVGKRGFYIVYKGINPKTKRREYTLADDFKEYKCRFEIVD